MGMKLLYCCVELHCVSIIYSTLAPSDVAQHLVGLPSWKVLCFANFITPLGYKSI